MKKNAFGAIAGTAAIAAALTAAPAFTNFAWALPTFPDVTVDTDHHEHISWLAGTGITKGYPDGSFRPMEMVYRQDMAAFLYRIAGEPVFTPTEDQKAAFSDVTDATPTRSIGTHFLSYNPHMRSKAMPGGVRGACRGCARRTG